MSNQIKVGQILVNKLSNGTQITVRVMELNVAGTDMVRVTDARETQSDAALINKNKTWACPVGNLTQTEAPVIHKSGLIALGG